MDLRKILESRNGRIGIGAGALVLLVMIFFVLTSGGDGLTVIDETTDINEASVWDLKKNNDPAFSAVEVVGDGKNHWKLMGPEANATSLRLMLNSKSNPGKMKKAACKEASMFTSGSAKNDSAICAQEHDAIEYLERLEAISGAVVNIKAPSSSIGETENDGGLNAIIYIDPTHADELPDGLVMAQALSQQVSGVVPANISIQDNHGTSIWPDNTGSSGGGSGGACTNNASQTDASSIDLQEKESLISSCYEARLRSWIGDIVEDQNAVDVLVQVRLNSEAKSKMVQDYMSSEPISESIQESDGSSSTTRTSQPGLSVLSSSEQPGGLESVSVAVTLHGVDPKVALTVRQQLSALYSANPANTYKVNTVSGKRKHKPTSAATESRPVVSPGVSNSNDASSAALSKPILAALFLLGITALTAIALLWRRNAALQGQRKMFEEEFHAERATFNQFANENPDDLARELEELLNPTRIPGGER